MEDGERGWSGTDAVYDPRCCLMKSDFCWSENFLRSKYRACTRGPDFHPNHKSNLSETPLFSPAQPSIIP